MCVNLKKTALLVAKHMGCGYTPWGGYAPPSPMQNQNQNNFILSAYDIQL